MKKEDLTGIKGNQDNLIDLLSSLFLSQTFPYLAASQMHNTIFPVFDILSLLLRIMPRKNSKSFICKDIEKYQE